MFLTLAFLPGLFFLQTQNDGLYLWVPQNTDLWQNFKYIRDNFGGQSRPLNVLITAADGGDLLNPESIRAIMDFHNEVRSGEECQQPVRCERNTHGKILTKTNQPPMLRLISPRSDLLLRCTGLQVRKHRAGVFCVLYFLLTSFSQLFGGKQSQRYGPFRHSRSFR